MTQTVSLSDAITLQRGFDLPTSQRQPGPYPVIASTGTTTTHTEAKVKGPGVVIGRSGSIGGGQYIEGDFWPLNTTLWVKDFKDNNEKFIYYLLKSIDFSSFNAGAAVPTLNRNHFSALKVRIPSRDEQDKIADILGTIDEKIELNRKMNETLEQMGQALFRHYFITNPDAEKWEVGKVGDVLSVLESGSRGKGGAAASGVPSIGAENIDGLGKYDFSKEKFVSEEFFDNAKRGKIKSEDVLLYKDGAYVGKKSLFMDGFPHKKCMVNEHVFILRTNERLKSHFYLYFWLDQTHITDKIVSNGVKAAQPGLNQSGVKTLPILIPESKTIEEFDNKVRPVMEKIYANSKQIQTLTTLRDTLLPKLISGKIKV